MATEAIDITEAELFGTIKAGPTRASLLALREALSSLTPAFTLWRWVRTPDGWRRSDKFRAPDIDKLLELLTQVEAWTRSSPLQRTTKKESVWHPTPRPGELEEPLMSTRQDGVELLIFAKDSSAGDAFRIKIRRPLGSESFANWFLASDIPSIEAVLFEGQQWLFEAEERRK